MLEAVPWPIAVRLVAALAYSAAVAWIYRRTTASSGTSLPVTLVLLGVLIAMVTQVIGDNVALAFSLVGALSIVRFRTVVRDTRDTAFVIFAVVVGMASGAENHWVAAFGLIVGGGTAFAMSRRSPSEERFLLTVRAGLAVDLDTVTRECPTSRRLASIGTARQGASIEASYDISIENADEAEELVRKLNRLDGVQDVRLERRVEQES